MTMRSFYATFMGIIAAEALGKNHSGKVMGVSSKGIFLECGRYILFITDAPYKSPFNIYVPGFERLLKLLNTRMLFTVDTTSIVFNESSLKIITGNAEVWTPEPPGALISAQNDRRQLLISVLNSISAIDPAKGWLFLFNNQAAFPEDVEERIRFNTRSFSAGYKAKDLETCLQSAGQLLGLGGGLTPSGDDWLAGFLLYQVCYRPIAGKSMEFLSQLTKELLAMAAQKTTTISVNRLMAAGKGWAEEPFLQVIDSLFTGQSVSENLVHILVNFGHSSGVDTTLGILSSLNCE